MKFISESSAIPNLFRTAYDGTNRIRFKGTQVF